jgi:hypothetical protein
VILAETAKEFEMIENRFGKTEKWKEKHNHGRNFTDEFLRFWDRTFLRLFVNVED